MADRYMIISAASGFERGVRTDYSVAHSESDAIRKAKQLAVQIGGPQEVYLLTPVGVTTAPHSEFVCATKSDASAA